MELAHDLFYISCVMNKNAGFTLVEVLIAMLVLAIGLLGLAALQINSLRNNQSAYNRTQATLLAYEMADRMRTNKFAKNAYVSTSSPVIQYACNSRSNSCTAHLMAKYDLVLWYAHIISALGALATGSVGFDPATEIFTITINWPENRDDDADGVSDSTSFTSSFKL
jgi:type IV pilus assembly protein PilV